MSKDYHRGAQLKVWVPTDLLEAARARSKASGPSLTDVVIGALGEFVKGSGYTHSDGERGYTGRRGYTPVGDGRLEMAVSEKYYAERPEPVIVPLED